MKEHTNFMMLLEKKLLMLKKLGIKYEKSKLKNNDELKIYLSKVIYKKHIK